MGLFRLFLMIWNFTLHLKGALFTTRYDLYRRNYKPNSGSRQWMTCPSMIPGIEPTLTPYL
jgi:hypothetical protein